MHFHIQEFKAHIHSHSSFPVLKNILSIYLIFFETTHKLYTSYKRAWNNSKALNSLVRWKTTPEFHKNTRTNFPPLLFRSLRKGRIVEKRIRSPISDSCYRPSHAMSIVPYMYSHMGNCIKINFLEIRESFWYFNLSNYSPPELRFDRNYNVEQKFVTWLETSMDCVP